MVSVEAPGAIWNSATSVSTSDEKLHYLIHEQVNLPRLLQVLPVRAELIDIALPDELELLRIRLELPVRGELLLVRDGERARRSGGHGRRAHERIHCTEKRLDARRQALHNRDFIHKLYCTLVYSYTAY